jgi:hypothetical protein
MSSLRINLNDLKFEKSASLEDLTNDELAELIQDLVTELLNRTKNKVSNITINNPYGNITTTPLTVGSPYTYTTSVKDLSVAIKNESKEVL